MEEYKSKTKKGLGKTVDIQNSEEQGEHVISTKKKVAPKRRLLSGDVKHKLGKKSEPDPSVHSLEPPRRLKKLRKKVARSPDPDLGLGTMDPSNLEVESKPKIPKKVSRSKSVKSQKITGSDDDQGSPKKKVKIPKISGSDDDQGPPNKTVKPKAKKLKTKNAEDPEFNDPGVPKKPKWAKSKLIKTDGIETGSESTLVRKKSKSVKRNQLSEYETSPGKKPNKIVKNKLSEDETSPGKEPKKTVKKKLSEHETSPGNKPKKIVKKILKKIVAGELEEYDVAPKKKIKKKAKALDSTGES